MKRIKKRSGFTLTELIVVLVMLAVLAAILIPALVHYVDSAREKRCLAEGRAARLALQTVCTEALSKGIDCSGGLDTIVNSFGSEMSLRDAAKKLSAVNTTNADYLSAEISDRNAVLSFSYRTTEDYLITYNGTDMTVTKIGK